MEQIRGKKLIELPSEDFSSLYEGYSEILLDVGTGDGLFVYKTALENPQWLCIGLEPAWKNCSETSAKALKKREKGGAPNALFIRGAIETPPVALKALAGRLFVNYPWGSLLSGVSAGEARVIGNLAELCRPAAELVINLNYSVFLDKILRDSLGLAELSQSIAEGVLAAAYAQAGLKLEDCQIIDGQPDISTSWGKHLVAGSARKTMILKFLKI